jgi:hypothetical protein
MKALHAIARPTLLVVALTLVACAKPAPVDPRTQAFSALPRWDGYWASATMVPEISGFDKAILSGDLTSKGPAALEGLGRIYPLAGISAPWTDAGRTKLFAMLGSMGNRKSDGWGYPMMMNGPAPMQFLITPEETLIVNMYREVRHIHTDGRALPAEEDRWATSWGESVGHWEGDTLIIQTTSVRSPPEFFQLAPPLSENAVYVERLRRTAPDRIESEITIEDPTTLTAPWKTTVVYMRQGGIDRLVHDSFANDRSDLDGATFTIAPP